MQVVNLTLDICAFIIIIITLCCAEIEIKEKNTRTRVLKAIIFTLMFGIAISLLAFICDLLNLGDNLVYKFTLASYFPQQIWFVLLVYYQLSFVKEKEDTSWVPARITALVLGTICFILVAISYTTELLVLDNGVWMPGTFLHIVGIIDLVVIMYYVIDCLKYIKVLGLNDSAALLIYAFIPVGCYFLDKLVPSLLCTYFGMSVSILICFLMVQHHDLRDRSENLKNQINNLNAVSSIYLTMHIINLKDNTVDELHSSDAVSAAVAADEAGKSAAADEMMHNVMRRVTSPKYVDRALKFTDVSTLGERLKDKNVISQDFVGNNVGWFRGSFVVIERNAKSEPVSVIWATQVIEDDKKREEGLVEISNTDELTGLKNRRAYEDSIEAYDSNRTPELTVASLDVNGLKQVNDNLGHNAGDELIVAAADCISKIIGTYGSVFRTGGDEFAAIFFAREEQLEKIRQDLDNIVENWSGELVKELTISAGFVRRAEMPSASLHEMFIQADKRMYEDKTQFYLKKGVDRRGQKDAYTALCGLYTKILKINLTQDTYQIVDMDESEKSKELGFADTLSEWLLGVANSGLVHPTDKDSYLILTNLDYMRKYFLGDKTSLIVFYRRRIGNEYKQVMMEVIPAPDYSNDNQNMFLYVKNIDK